MATSESYAKAQLLATTYEEAVKLATDALDNRIEQNLDILRTTPIQMVLLGGYARQVLCRRYGFDVERGTKDIDLYCPATRAIFGAEAPRGTAIVTLKDGFDAELIDWISGDDAEDLKGRLDAQLGNREHLLKASKHCEIYSPTPAMFIANKLFAYRSMNGARGKDLRDVATMVKVLDAKDFAALADVENLVGRYALKKDYVHALTAEPFVLASAL